MSLHIITPNHKFTGDVEFTGNVTLSSLTIPKYESVYTTVNASSGKWDSTYTTLNTTSGSWNSVYTTVNANSGYYAMTNKDNTFNGNLVVNGSLTALGTSTFTNTVFTTTSALSVINNGTGPALYVSQTPGNYDVASFYDRDGIEVLHVGNAPTTGTLAKVGINESYPQTELTVRGSISAMGGLSATAITDSWHLLEGSVTEGLANIASGLHSHAEGVYNVASGLYSHVEGGSISDTSLRNTASGASAHAQGRGTVAGGDASHAEGITTKAYGLAAHVQGLSSVALGDFSFAAGTNAFALGTRSTAVGQFTTANKVSTYVSGRWALADHSRAWVWHGTGNENIVFTSTRQDQFAIRPTGGFYLSGGMGINTDANDQALTVVGTISTNNHKSSSDWNSGWTTLNSTSGKWVVTDPALVASTPAPSAVSNIVMLTQAAYNSLGSYNGTTLYIII